MENFNRSGYLGTWYEESNMFEVYQIASSCVRATYTDEGDRVGVFNEGLTAVWVVDEVTEFHIDVLGSDTRV